MCIIEGIMIFVLHMCTHVVGPCEYAGAKWPYNDTLHVLVILHIAQIKLNFAERDLEFRMEFNLAFRWELP